MSSQSNPIIHVTFVKVYLAVVAAMILFHYDYWQTVWIVTWTTAGGILLIAAAWTHLPRHLTLSLEVWLETRLQGPITSFVKAIKAAFRGSRHMEDPSESPQPSSHHPSAGEEDHHAIQVGRASLLSRRASRTASAEMR